MNNGLIAIPVPTDLKTALEQTGHLWAIERRFDGYTREDIVAPYAAESLVSDIYIEVWFWAGQDAALTGWTHADVRKFVADEAARRWNVDLDGRTAKLPKHRAETVQTSYGKGDKAIKTVLGD